MLRLYERRETERRTEGDRSDDRRAHESTLYSRLGGSAAVAAAVEVFYKKVMADESLNHFFAKTDIEKLCEKQTSYFVQALGGAQEYVGKDMREAHANVKGITEAHFTSFMDHLYSTLVDFGVPNTEISEILAIAVKTHDDVLGK